MIPNLTNEHRTLVVIPVHSHALNRDESNSVARFRAFLSSYPTVVIGPGCFRVTTPSELSDLKIVSFDDRYFDSRDSYSRLLLSKGFYRQFLDYEFLLIYQLDCLVFSKEIPLRLIGTCDYVGAPWFRSSRHPECGYLGVGNGGLSLRRVQAAVDVLESADLPPYSLALAAANRMPDLKLYRPIRRFQKALSVIGEARRGVGWYTSHYTLNEDKFWSFRARLFDPSFNIAPVERALEFSFECFPRYCYELNGRRLPFGCHAWAKHDREFWGQFVDVSAAG